MSRYDLTDFEWHAIEPLLPNKPRGVPRVDDRRVLNGIFTAIWCTMARPAGAIWSSHHRRRKAGVWDMLMDAITAPRQGNIQMIDSTSVRAHQQAATAHNQDPCCRKRARAPIRLGLTAGQAHDGQIVDVLFDHLGPRIVVLADKAYDADRIRELTQNGVPRPTSL
jgi:transposase